MYRNALLNRLPEDELAVISPHLIEVPMISRQSLYEPQHPVTELFFVEEGMVSLVIDIANEENIAAEVGIVGYEGVVGSSALLYPDPTIAYRAMCQANGKCLRLNAGVARGLLENCPEFRSSSFRYIDTLMKQTAQIAGCNLRHTVNERLSRWLLMTRDRLEDDILPLTQDFLATMLGVRRAGVSLAASTLQQAGLIRQQRGRVIILDATALEQSACACYYVIRDLYGLHVAE